MRLHPSLIGTISKILRGKASQTELQKFNKWYDSTSSDDVELVDHLGRSKAEIEKELFSKIQGRTQVSREKKFSGTPKERKLSFGWVAASILLLISCGLVWNHYQTDRVTVNAPTLAYVTFENGTGMFKKVKLPDGSTVKLFHKSRIQVSENFSENRFVKLEGEAFFEVERDTLHPFRVESQHLITEVLGTSFLIRNSEDFQEIVAVKTGLVKVSNQADTSFLLEPNYRLDFSSGLGNVSKMAENDPLFAWTEEVLVFDHTEMETMVSDLENWYGVTISHNLSEKIQCEISGTYERQSLENLLELINYSIPITYQISGKNVTLHFKDCP
ncbi:DUF4974 domain-containing protein [Algoriphagus aestuarii]|nr:DUF4974 domain-containing protein [Algoriphagus aestuarii]